MPWFLAITANHCVWGFVIAIIVVSTKLSAEISFEWWLTVPKADGIDSGDFIVLQIILVFVLDRVNLLDGADLTSGRPPILVDGF